MPLDHKLPKGWRTAKLGEIADVDWGNTSLTKSSYANAGFTAFSATGPDGFMSSFEHDEDAVVLSAIGANCGKCFFATGKWTAIKNTIVIRSKGDLLPKFFFYISNQPRFWKIRGAAQPFISLGDSRTLQVVLPPPPTQRKIVEILDAADELRKKRRETDEKMKDLIPAIFVKMFGDPATNPMGWEVRKLGEITECLDKRRKPIEKSLRSIGEIPYYGATGRVGWIDNYIFDEKLLLIAEDGGKWGSFESASYIIEGKSWVNNHAHVLKALNGVCTEEYLMTYINMRGLLDYISGTTRGKLTKSSMASISIALSPYALQSEFSSHCTAIKANMGSTQNAEAILMSLFDSLMHKAFRGELG